MTVKSERNIQIYRQRLEGMTYQAIAEIHCINPERIRMIHARMMRLIKQAEEAGHTADSFLEAYAAGKVQLGAVAPKGKSENEND